LFFSASCTAFFFPSLPISNAETFHFLVAANTEFLPSPSAGKSIFPIGSFSNSVFKKLFASSS
jgi:hypothetical protein